MTLRSELETRLLAFANSYSPILPVSLENVPDDTITTAKTNLQPFLESFIKKASSNVITVDATRFRERGVLQINVWWPSPYGEEYGMGGVEAIAQAIQNTFVVYPRIGSVYFTDIAHSSPKIMDVAGWIIVPVILPYLQDF